MSRNRKIGHELKSLNNLMCRGFERDMKKYMGGDATVMHVWILIYIAKCEPQDVFQRDIEQEFDIAKSTVTSILKLMEKKGLLTRKSVSYDNRLKKLCPTDKGRHVMESMRAAAEAADKALIAGIDEERLDIFYSVLDKIRKNAESQISLFHTGIQ